MGGAAQFGVDAETLNSLAGRFEREAKELEKPVAAFSATAADIGQAFGLLGACDGAADKYRQLLQHTSRALGQLPLVLRNDAERLRVSAANYTASDQAALHHVRSVKPGGRT
ncbi:WXG100 family type VII secretion target [Streptomyces lydicus]|uniref:WXG100 family type VII secretion target n=1 Tax=Streptomyces lydicus TaxID=47763 RepID=UPI0036FC92FB